MAKRSLIATDAGIRKAKQAFQRTGWTQSEFAMEVGLSTRQPIWKFFNSRPVERAVFVDICFSLNLEWEEIAGVGAFALGNAAATSDLGQSSSDSQPLVAMVQAHLWERQQQQYRWMPVSLDLAQPLPLTSYVPQRVWTRPRRLWGLGVDAGSAIEGAAEEMPWGDCLPLLALIDRHPKLILQGQLGGGKTTALRFLAQSCLRPATKPANKPEYGPECGPECGLDYHSETRPNHGMSKPLGKVPLFVQLDESMDFAAHLGQQWQTAELSLELFTTLSRQGHLLLLLDGFHQLSASARCRLRNQIEQWSQLYPLNSIVLTCRPSCDEAHFYDFAVVELAPWNTDQIQTFVTQWFAVVEPEGGDRLAQRFLVEWVHTPWANEQGLAPSITPLLIHRLCLWFRRQKSILTHSASFYQGWLDLLLFRWARVAGHPAQSANLLQGELQSLSHLAVQTALVPHSRHGMASMTQPWPHRGMDQSGVATPWTASPVPLTHLCYDYGLLQEVNPSDYQFVDPYVQLYLCAIHYANPIAYSHTIPDLLQSLDCLSFDKGVFLFRTLISLSPDPNQLLRLLFGHWQPLILQVHSLQPFLAWVRHRAEQSPMLNPSFVQAFYFVLARRGAVAVLNLFGPTALTKLSSEMWRDIHRDYCLNDVQNLSLDVVDCAGGDDRSNGALNSTGEHNPIGNDLLQSSQLSQSKAGTTILQDRTMMPNKELTVVDEAMDLPNSVPNASPKGWPNDWADDWLDGRDSELEDSQNPRWMHPTKSWRRPTIESGPNQYDPEQPWLWPANLEGSLANFDRALAMVMVALQEEGSDYLCVFLNHRSTPSDPLSQASALHPIKTVSPLSPRVTCCTAI